MDPADLGLRAHEILENTVQFELTGRTDYGSGTNLATARANLDGTRVLLGRLRPLLTSRDTGPGRARLVAGPHPARARQPPTTTATGRRLDRLARAQREQVNADLGELVERLADVAALCDVRRTA